jgi:hypothetical protein
MSSFLPALAFAAVLTAQFAAVVAARAVAQNAPSRCNLARGTQAARASGEFRT